jgi:hypothetical protein
MDGYRAALGMPDAQSITLNELQARRRIIRERLAKRGRRDFTSTGSEKDPVGR